MGSRKSIFSLLPVITFFLAGGAAIPETKQAALSCSLGEEMRHVYGQRDFLAWTFTLTLNNVTGAPLSFGDDIMIMEGDGRGLFDGCYVAYSNEAPGEQEDTDYFDRAHAYALSNFERRWSDGTMRGYRNGGTYSFADPPDYKPERTICNTTLAAGGTMRIEKVFTQGSYIDPHTRVLAVLPEVKSGRSAYRLVIEFSPSISVKGGWDLKGIRTIYQDRAALLKLMDSAKTDAAITVLALNWLAQGEPAAAAPVLSSIIRSRSPGLPLVASIQILSNRGIEPDAGTLDAVRFIASSSSSGDWSASAAKRFLSRKPPAGQGITALAVLKAHTPDSRVAAISFSPDGKLLASGSGGDNTVKLWDMPGGGYRKTLIEYDDDVSCVSFSPDGKLIASVSTSFNNGDSIMLWDTAQGALMRSLTASSRTIRALSFSPDGRTLMAVMGGGAPVELFDVATGMKTASIPDDGFICQTARFSPDGKTIAWASDLFVKLWDIVGKRLIRTLRGQVATVNFLSFSPDAKLMITGSLDAIALFDVGSGEIAWIAKDDDLVYSLAVRPDGKIIAEGCTKGIKVRDAADGKIIATVKSPAGAPLAFSPDGKTLASSSGGGSLTLWDVSGISP